MTVHNYNNIGINLFVRKIRLTQIYINLNITHFQLSYVFFPIFLFTLRKDEKPESLCGLCSRARAWLPSNLFLFFLLVVVRAHAVRLF